MPPPTPDRAAADREALNEWRASRGHVWDREGCQEYSEAAYLAGAEHGRADAERGGGTLSGLAIELARQRDEFAAQLGRAVDEKSTLRSDLATARADLEHARKACKGFQELYEASCRDVMANCERAEKAEGELERVRAERDEAREDLSASQDARYRVAKAMESTPAPRPDEAALADLGRAVIFGIPRTVSRASATTVRVESTFGEPIWSAALSAALTRASSPAPSPVEAAAGRLRAGLERIGSVSPDAALGPIKLADIRAVLDALGAEESK